jgi:cytidylate kinase
MGLLPAEQRVQDGEEARMTETYTGPAEPGPLHGYRGEPSQAGADRWPSGLTIALSRESGARGGSIAKRVGSKLGWQVVDQELLEFLTQDELAFQELPAAAREWADERLDQLLRAQVLSTEPGIIALTRSVLLLGSQGEVVLVGRGAGYLLPPATTLHVRVVAPQEDRIAYMSQWMRLSAEEAAEEVRRRDDRRAEFLSTNLRLPANDPYSYDFILNSSRLGEEASAELIVQAARGKLLGLEPAAEVAPRLPDAPE